MVNFSEQSSRKDWSNWFKTNPGASEDWKERQNYNQNISNVRDVGLKGKLFCVFTYKFFECLQPMPH